MSKDYRAGMPSKPEATPMDALIMTVVIQRLHVPSKGEDRKIRTHTDLRPQVLGTCGRPSRVRTAPRRSEVVLGLCRPVS